MPRALLRPALVLALVCSLFPGSPVALAQEPDASGAQPAPATAARQDHQQLPRLEERITVTATRLEEEAGDVGSSVTVITREEILASGAVWLYDVLARVPGVTVVRNGGPGKLGGVFLRGTNGNQTLVLVNGLKVNSPTTGDYGFSRIAASQIERIEVLRGPQSTLYGSDAIGGVINIITRSAVGPTRVTLSADGGSFATGRAALGIQGTASGLRYAVGADYTSSDSFSAAAEGRGNDEPDGFENTALDARVGLAAAEGLDLEGVVTYLDGRSDIDGFAFGVGPVDDLEQTQSGDDLYAAVTARYDRGPYSGVLTLSTSDLHIGTVDPDGFFTSFDLDASIRELDLQNAVRLDGSHTLVAGAEVRRESARVVNESAFGPSGFDEDVDFVGLYAQERFIWRDRVHVTAGLRYEDHSRFGDKTTFRLASSVRAARWRLHGSVGTGFRAPTFNELFFPGFGNPTLGPEESVGWDLGVSRRWSAAGLGFDVTYFRNDIDDLVVFGSDGFVNIGEVLTAGVETTLDWSPTGTVRVDATYTHTDATDRSTGERLLRRPEHQGGLAVRFRPGESTSLFGELRVKGSRLDVGVAGPVQQDAYAVLNAAAQVSLAEGLELTGRVENLTDTGYEELFGFGTAGLSGYVGLRYTWLGQ